MDPHSFYADPDPAVFLNADPDPGGKMNADPDPQPCLIGTGMFSNDLVVFNVVFVMRKIIPLS